MWLLIIGSSVLSILDVAVLLLIARRYRWGWIANLVVNTLWFPYDVVTRQLGFLILGFAYYYVIWQGWKHHND